MGTLRVNPAKDAIIRAAKKHKRNEITANNEAKKRLREEEEEEKMKAEFEQLSKTITKDIAEVEQLAEEKARKRQEEQIAKIQVVILLFVQSSLGYCRFYRYILQTAWAHSCIYLILVYAEDRLYNIFDALSDYKL